MFAYMLANFGRTMRDSIYNPDFYELLDERTVWQSIGYFFMLGAVVGFVISFVSAVEYTPIFKSFVERHAIVSYWPPNLTVEIRNGVASSTLSTSPTSTEPIALAMPASMQHLDGPGNLLVIDTSTSTSSATALATKNTLAVLTRRTIILSYGGLLAPPDSGETIPLAGMPDATINRATLAQINGWLADHTASLMVFYFAGIYIRFLILLILYFAYFFLFTPIAFLIARFFGHDHVSYRDAYIASLHAFTLPLIAGSALSAAGLDIPFWLWGATFSAMILFINWRPQFVLADDSEENGDENH